MEELVKRLEELEKENKSLKAKLDEYDVVCKNLHREATGLEHVSAEYVNLCAYVSDETALYEYATESKKAEAKAAGIWRSLSRLGYM